MYAYGKDVKAQDTSGIKFLRRGKKKEQRATVQREDEWGKKKEVFLLEF